jgi:hypothetical protein
MVPFRDGCVKTSKCASNSAFAWETGRVIDNQSPFGEITLGLRSLADANALKADTVSEEGWTKAFTFGVDVSDVGR